MTVAAARKQQKEVDTVLKKVEDGQDEFAYVFDQAHSASGAQKEKLGEDLKKSINKLQRLRVQIREWTNQNDMKGQLKDKLEDARKKIENDMTRFKEFERDLKTKAFSSNALARGEELDEGEADKIRWQDWVSSTIQQLNDQRDEFEADLEVLSNKKNLSNDEKIRLPMLREWQDRHDFHIRKLELILRALDNEALEMSDLAILRDSVDYYLESHAEPGFMYDDGLYDSIDLVEFEEKAKPRTPSMDGTKDTASSKDEPKKGKEKDRKKKEDKKDKKKEDKKAAATPQSATVAGKQAVVVSSKRGEMTPMTAKEAAQQAAAGGADAKAVAEKKPSRSIVDDLAEDEEKVLADQLLGEAEEFICKICQVHVVGCSPKLTNCSHLFCGDCLSQWFAQHPESQTWAQRARSAGPERVVPCPVCKQPLNEKKDLYPVCGATSRSENLLLWRMLSSLKIVCMNSCQLRKKDGRCDWVGEYGQYQKHVKACQNLPVAETPHEPLDATRETPRPPPAEKAQVARPEVATPAAPVMPVPATQPTLSTQAPSSRPVQAAPQEVQTPVGAAPRSAPGPSLPAPRVQPQPQQQKMQPPQPPQPPQPSQPQQPSQPPRVEQPQPQQPQQQQPRPQQPQQQPQPQQQQQQPQPQPQQQQQQPQTQQQQQQSQPQQQPQQPQLSPQSQPQSPAASPTSPKDDAPAPSVIRATSPFEPTGPNMVKVRPGDLVQVLERHTSGWSFCKNLSAPSGSNVSSGWAPSWVVQALSGAEEEKAPTASTASQQKESLRPAAVAAAPTPQHNLAAAAPAQSSPAAAPAAAKATAQVPQPSQSVSRPEATSPAAAASASKAPQTIVRSAVAPFSAATSSQLTIALGDLIEIVERDNSGWTYGRKVTQPFQPSQVEGWFPDWCTQK